MSNELPKEKSEEVVLKLKSGINSLKSGLELLEKGFKSLEEKILNKKILENLQKVVYEELEISQEKVGIKIEKIKVEPEFTVEHLEETLEEKQPLPEGIDIGVILAKNLGKKVLASASFNLIYAKLLAESFYKIAKREIPFEIKDKRKLKMLAYSLGIDANLSEKEILDMVSEKILKIFSPQKGAPIFIHRAPQSLIEKWEKFKVMPNNIEEDLLELAYKTLKEGDNYYKNILFSALKCAIADGWVNSVIATELKDVLSGAPKPTNILVGIGERLIQKNKINIAICESDPILRDSLIKACNDKEILELAKENGAEGINLVGVINPVAGILVDREDFLLTKAIEAVIVDMYLPMSDLMQKASKFHTVVITTNPLFMLEGAIHIEFNKKYPLECAKEILKVAISRYSKRNISEVFIPDKEKGVVLGFGLESLMYAMGGSFRASLSPLNENIINGKILGIVLILGNNFSMKNKLEILKELIKNNVFVLTAGCQVEGIAELLTPEAAEISGEGLKEFLETIGLPPVLYMGSYMESSRILSILKEMVNIGDLGKDISELPVAGWGSQLDEKTISMGLCFSASGVQVIFGKDFPEMKSKKVSKFLSEEMKKCFGGAFDFVEKENEIVSVIIDRINQKREKLGIHKPKPRVLYDMAMRRTLEERRYIPFIHKLGFFRDDNS